MEWILERSYHTLGTNGKLFIKGQTLPFCFTIELPWQQNTAQLSCIPEGAYPLVLRQSEKFKTHLHVQNVPGRQLILVHPANDALAELKGCIAPVSVLTGNGQGKLSRRAFERLLAVAKDVFSKNETLLLTITSPHGAGEQNTLV